MQNTPKFAYHIILTIILLKTIHTQTTIILYPNINAVTTSPVIIYNSSLPNSINTVTNKPIQSQSFIQQANNFYCSLNPLYTYIPANQSTYALQYTSMYTIIISNITNASLQISISTRYGSISTNINNTSLITCNSISKNCILQVNNICNNKLNYFNYFDIVMINFTMFEKNVSYNVLCNSNFKGNSFQYGLLVQIVFITGLVGIVAIYSNAWSIGGAGIRLSWLIVLLFLLILVVGGIISIFYFTFIATSVTVLSWIFGIASVWLCSNELLYLLSRLQFLRKSLIKIKTITIRVLDILSIFIAVGVCMAWWFSGKNWILNDVVAVCISIAFIKIFKFTSMKQALICFVMTVSIQIIFVLVIDLFLHNNYNSVILNIFNNPFELQVPTINPVYNQKCSWLPFTAIIYPGILMSYMRRFDDSRNTKIYSITCISMFFVGSLIWLTMSIVTEQSFPFGLIAEPATLGFVSLFAWKRKQIRTLWTGKFYDEQFAHKQGLQQLNQSIKKQRDKTQIVYSPDLFTGLEVKDEQSSMQYPLQKYEQLRNKNKQMIDLPFIMEIDQQNSNNSSSLQQNLIDRNNDSENNRDRNQTKIQMVQILSKVIKDQQIKQTLQQNKNNNIKKFPQPMQKNQTQKNNKMQQLQLQYNQ